MKYFDVPQQNWSFLVLIETGLVVEPTVDNLFQKLAGGLMAGQ